RYPFIESIASATHAEAALSNFRRIFHKLCGVWGTDPPASYERALLLLSAGLCQPAREIAEFLLSTEPEDVDYSLLWIVTTPGEPVILGERRNVRYSHNLGVLKELSGDITGAWK